MGRKNGFEKAAKKDEELNKDQIINERLNQEDIGTEEIAAMVGITDRSVRDILKKLCNKYEELNLQDFKEGRPYKFKASWNGLLTTLIEVAGLPQYDNRKDQSSLEGHTEHLNVLITGINTYLNDIDRKLVKSHSTYQQAELELKLYDSLLHRIGNVVNQVGMMPSFLRFQTLAGINEALEYVPSQMAHVHSRYLLQKQLYKKDAEESNEINTTSFREDLEAYLVSLLNLRLQGQDGIDESFKIEVVGSTLLEQLVLGDLTAVQSNGIETLVTKTREDILEQSEIKQTLQKVKTVLDSDEVVDQVVLNWIEKILLLLAMSDGSNNKSKEIGKELVRQSVIGNIKLSE
jgi:arsenate reductase-like glutaredoxin family protein